MPSVILRYGPYEANGVIKHRTQRLHGLMTRLTQKHYEVEIVPSIHINRLTIEMEGSIIYQCDIRNLLFNMDYEDDIVCQRVYTAINEAASRIYCIKNIPAFASVKEGKRYTEKSKTLKTEDFFDSSVGLLYEHQVHLRGVLDMYQEFSEQEDEKYMSIQDSQLGWCEDDDFYFFDEYADWDFASGIIRSILESLPEPEFPDPSEDNRSLPSDRIDVFNKGIRHLSV